MNDNTRDDAAALPEPPELPELSDARVEAIEDALFAQIDSARADAAARAAADRRRSARRGRIWMGGAAAAAVVAIAAIIAPSVGGLVGSSGSAGSASDAMSEPAPAIGSAEGFSQDSMMDGAVIDGATTQGTIEGAAGQAVADGAARSIITTSTATVRVDDPRAAAEAVAAAAAERGGFVETMSIGETGDAASDPSSTDGGIVYDTMPYAPYSGTWLTVRVPSAELPALRSELAKIGEVTASEISQQDVTLQVVDVQARVDAAETSVARLTELMAQASSVTDLLAAETALSQRQAELESWQQQLTYLQDQVEMSSLTVTLVPRTVQVDADPAGFVDGLAVGWNGLVATLNGLVIALGFLLPWIAITAIVGAIVWVIVRAVRRRRDARVVAPDGE